MSEQSDRHAKIALLSVLLENRKLGWAMLGGGLCYLVISLLGIHLFSCPLREITGWQCPGCGLTRGSRAMLQGNWAFAFTYNWFTPVFMIFWAAVGVGLILPEPWRGKFLVCVKNSERITWWPAILGILLIIYALTRNIVTG